MSARQLATVEPRRVQEGRTEPAPITIKTRKPDNPSQTSTRIYFFNVYDHRAEATLLPEIYRALGMPERTRARYDRHLGCRMCPCSPGFLIRDGGARDVLVTVGQGFSLERRLSELSVVEPRRAQEGDAEVAHNATDARAR